MRARSLAEAKAHLSSLVDDAEHRGKSTVILRHGKPSAVLVPLAATQPTTPAGLTRADARKLLDSFVSLGDPGPGAVDDLLASRR